MYFRVLQYGSGLQAKDHTLEDSFFAINMAAGYMNFFYDRQFNE